VPAQGSGRCHTEADARKPCIAHHSSTRIVLLQVGWASVAGQRHVIRRRLDSCCLHVMSRKDRRIPCLGDLHIAEYEGIFGRDIASLLDLDDHSLAIF
jgi:hypothetical protein